MAAEWLQTNNLRGAASFGGWTVEGCIVENDHYLSSLFPIDERGAKGLLSSSMPLGSANFDQECAPMGPMVACGNNGRCYLGAVQK